MHTVLAALLALLGLAGQVTPAFAQGYLHASGIYIADGANKNILLRGMGLGGWLVPEGYMIGTSSFANSATEFKNKVRQVVGDANAEQFFQQYRKYFVQRKDVDSLARWGFNSIRLPMHYNLLTSAPGVYTESGFATIDSLLAWCEANRIYLILDLHAAPGGQNTANISDYQGPPCLWEDATLQTWTAELWKTLAARYADRTWIGGYDLLNETVYSFPSGNGPMRNLMKRITDSIRTVDKNHLIFVEGNSWANDFSGLPPAWDNNMAWSFHKYWNVNDQNSIQTYLNLRGSTNIPIWMGEAGENSNHWFAEAIALLERYNFGWCWWTLKKIETVSAPLSVTKVAGFDALLKYWSGSGPAPTLDAAVKALNDQALMLDADKCTFHPDYLDALFRMPFTTDRTPYTDNVIPGVVYAVNYDMGKDIYAYHDSKFQNTSQGGSYNDGWVYRNDGVDIEKSTDGLGNGYNVGWTSAEEFLAYTVRVTTGGTYKIRVRAASANTGGTVRLSMDNAWLTPAIGLPGTGGWQAWVSTDCGNYVLTAGTHDLVLSCITGGYNLSRLEFTLVSAAVEEQPARPAVFALEQNYPNPFNPSTVVGYQLPAASKVRLAVFDLLGREVAVIAEGVKPAGSHKVTFDGSHLPSGIYFYRLNAVPLGGASAGGPGQSRSGELVQTRVMALTK